MREAAAMISEESQARDLVSSAQTFCAREEENLGVAMCEMLDTDWDSCRTIAAARILKADAEEKVRLFERKWSGAILLLERERQEVVASVEEANRQVSALFRAFPVSSKEKCLKRIRHARDFMQSPLCDAPARADLNTRLASLQKVHEECTRAFQVSKIAQKRAESAMAAKLRAMEEIRRTMRTEETRRALEQMEGGRMEVEFRGVSISAANVLPAQVRLEDVRDFILEKMGREAYSEFAWRVARVQVEILPPRPHHHSQQLPARVVGRQQHISPTHPPGGEGTQIHLMSAGNPVPMPKRRYIRPEAWGEGGLPLPPNAGPFDCGAGLGAQYAVDYRCPSALPI